MCPAPGAGSSDHHCSLPHLPPGTMLSPCSASSTVYVKAQLKPHPLSTFNKRVPSTCGLPGPSSQCPWGTQSIQGDLKKPSKSNCSMCKGLVAGKGTPQWRNCEMCGVASTQYGKRSVCRIQSPVRALMEQQTTRLGLTTGHLAGTPTGEGQPGGKSPVPGGPSTSFNPHSHPRLLRSCSHSTGD